MIAWIVKLVLVIVVVGLVWWQIVLDGDSWGGEDDEGPSE